MCGRPHTRKVASACGCAKNIRTPPPPRPCPHLWSFITPYTCNNTKDMCVKTSLNSLLWTSMPNIYVESKLVQKSKYTEDKRAMHCYIKLCRKQRRQLQWNNIYQHITSTLQYLSMQPHQSNLHSLNSSELGECAFSSWDQLLEIHYQSPYCQSSNDCWGDIPEGRPKNVVFLHPPSPCVLLSTFSITSHPLCWTSAAP